MQWHLRRRSDTIANIANWDQNGNLSDELRVGNAVTAATIVILADTIGGRMEYPLDDCSPIALENSIALSLPSLAFGEFKIRVKS